MAGPRSRAARAHGQANRDAEITLYPWVHPDEERCATSCGAR
jgi:hypothetical protein